jgi:hypothetical protein
MMIVTELTPQHFRQLDKGGSLKRRGAGHTREWIEAAKSEYWQLIDTEYRLEDLYNLVNVPQAT